MFSRIKSLTKKFLSAAIDLFGKTRAGDYFFEVALKKSMTSTRSVEHHGIRLKFSVPNSLNRWRIDTFSSKEPETLEWIDSLPKGAIVWDVGANVGLYSCYAAKARNCRIYAFEPSVFNLELLARNIFLNDLGDKVTIVPLPLSDSISVSAMRMTSTDWGGALSTFGKDFGWDGNKIRQVFEFSTIGISMEDAVRHLQVPVPEYVKVDVDGLEHFILKGGAQVLAKVSGILIEVNDDFHEQAENCHHLLTAAGLVMREKRQSDMMSDSASGFASAYNQIWVRP